MAGYEGELLEVNLTTRAIKTSTVDTVDKETLRKFIGDSLPDLSSTHCRRGFRNGTRGGASR